ncbi:CHAT domain-containing protein [Actinomadura sp. 3N407]|uniref:CHAT domain-containing protein n=1 Tax=Actinomadura sp. 3N407 TaxID=3457423 RepID=UPI003FCD244D
MTEDVMTRAMAAVARRIAVLICLDDRRAVLDDAAMEDLAVLDELARRPTRSGGGSFSVYLTTWLLLARLQSDPHLPTAELERRTADALLAQFREKSPGMFPDAADEVIKGTATALPPSPTLWAFLTDVLTATGGAADRSLATQLIMQRATVLAGRYMALREPDDLDAAMALVGEALEATEHDGPELGIRLATSSHLHQLRYERDVEPTDLEEAVRAGEKAVALLTGDGRSSFALNAAGLAMLERFRVDGRPEDADQAVAWLRIAAGDRASNEPAADLTNLAVALRERDPVGTVRPDDLTEAIALYEKALGRTSEDDPSLPGLLADLSEALRTAAEQHSDPALLDRAVETAEGAVARAGEHANGMLQANLWAHLGAARGLRARQTESMEGFNRAVEAKRRAIEISSAGGHPGLPAHLHNLGMCLHDRFHRSQQLDDLEEATRAQERAVEMTPPDAPDRYERLHGLSITSLTHYSWSRDPARLERAVEAAGEAVTGTSPGDPMFPSRLQQLGTAVARAARRPDAASGALDLAVTCMTRALNLTPPESPYYVGRLVATAEALTDAGDRAEAERLLAEAVERSPTTDPRRCLALASLARIRLERAAREREDRPAAIDPAREAARMEHGPVVNRLLAAEVWGVAAGLQEDWTEAAEAHALAIDLLAMTVGIGQDRRSAEAGLARRPTLASDAAACAIAAGDPRAALDVLERGRAVLWAQMLELRTELDAVEAADPDLARTLREAAAVLGRDPAEERERGTSIPSPRTGPVSSGRAAVRPEPLTTGRADRRIEAAETWWHGVARARAEYGLMRPPDPAEMRAATSGGWHIVINVSEWRCDALAVRDGRIQVIPLDVGAEEINERVDLHVAALAAFEEAPGGLAATVPFGAAVAGTVEWLWDAVAGPVLEALGLGVVTGDDWPRVWWCPTGRLALLPLHAAGHHGARDGRAVIDRVVSSYTPTLGTRIGAPEASRAGRMLVVTAGASEGERALPYVAEQLAVLERTFPEGARTVLTDENATADRVRDGLATHTWAHLACHGVHDLSDPARGGIVLHRERITTPELAAESSGHGEFVCLSACKTAMTGDALADEMVTVAAAFHYTGWRHVVAALWSIDDKDAFRVVDLLYGGELAPRPGVLEPGNAAAALHHTIRTLRDTKARGGVWTWAAYVHIGP